MNTKKSNEGFLATSDESELAAKIREAIGATSDEEVRFRTPQFERGPMDPEPAKAQRYRQWWEDLRTLDLIGLKELGCGQWNDPTDDDANPGEFDGGTLMLFPGEWYSMIPPGFEIITISDKRESFSPGETDDDIRFGCLSYGILAAKGQ